MKDRSIIDILSLKHVIELHLGIILCNYVEGCKLSNDGAELLSKMKSLKALHLWRNLIEDEGVKYLSTLFNL
jgi:hypothetical protein